MNYVAVQQGGECAVEVTQTSPGHFRVCFEGHVLEVDGCVAADGRSQSLLIDGCSFVAQVARRGSFVDVDLGVAQLRVEMLDLRRARLRQVQTHAAEHAGSQVLCAPMPGRIVAVLVQQGDHVEAGQGLVVIEAMKMENELRAPRTGTVTQLQAMVGAAVESGAALCEVG